MPFVYAEIVEKQKWLAEKDFVEMLAMGQLLPGANVTNFAAMFGFRVAGWSGVCACVGGLVVPPGILLYFIYQIYLAAPVGDYLQNLLNGILCVAAALVFTTGIKLLRTQLKKSNGDKKVIPWSLFFGLAALVAVGIFELPLFPVLATLAPLSFLHEWWISKPEGSL